MYYLISYDIAGDDEQYENLYAQLEYDKAERVLLSQWVMKSDDPINIVYMTLHSLLSPGDRLLILDITVAIESNPEWLRPFNVMSNSYIG